jgi:large subunit ribosomal protein L4
MAELKVLNKAGEEVGTVNASDAVFGIEPNTSAMHMAVVNYLANQRQGTQSTKTRAEVSGGGKKPWRQKGTGNARQGSTRSPQWYHGGVALGPKPRSYRFAINKKVRRLAMKSALSAKVRDGEMIVLDSFGLDGVKTKDGKAVLSAIGAGKKTLVVLPENDSTVYLSLRNIPGVKVSTVSTINTYDLLNNDSLVVLQDAVAKIEEVYA